MSTGTSPSPTTTTACIERCKRGFAFVASTGRCLACPAGTFSLGGMAPCLTCAGLGYGPNTYIDPRRSGGCMECGVPSEVVPATTTSGATCRTCAQGKFVAPGATVCRVCETLGQYYVPMGGSSTTAATACQDCSMGTFKTSVTATSCTLCPANTYGHKRALSTPCLPCANGTRHSVNRTTCVPCAPLNGTLSPYVQYYEAGCNIRCTPGVSYLRTNIYAENGCGDCAAVTVPVGAYKVCRHSHIHAHACFHLFQSCIVQNRVDQFP